MGLQWLALACRLLRWLTGMWSSQAPPLEVKHSPPSSRRLQVEGERVVAGLSAFTRNADLTVPPSHGFALSDHLREGELPFLGNHRVARRRLNPASFPKTKITPMGMQGAWKAKPFLRLRLKAEDQDQG